MAKNPYAEMARILAEKLSSAELTRLHALLDQDARYRLDDEIGKIEAERHPEFFADENAPPKPTEVI